MPLAWLLLAGTLASTKLPAIAPTPGVRQADADCFVGAHVFADGNIATVSGLQAKSASTETFVWGKSGWQLWMRYAHGHATYGALRARSCATQPLARVATVRVNPDTGALSPLLAEYIWLAVLRSGEPETLRWIQIREFAGIRESGAAQGLSAETEAMRQRHYRVLGNCITSPSITRTSDIASIHAPYDEYARFHTHLVRIRYDSTDTFVLRLGRWYAASGFARYVGWSTVSKIPQSCTPEGNVNDAIAEIASIYHVPSLAFAALSGGKMVNEFLLGATRHTLFQVGS